MIFPILTPAILYFTIALSVTVSLFVGFITPSDNRFRWFLIVALSIVLTAMGTQYGVYQYRKTDDVNYVFIEDPGLTGVWLQMAWVKSPGDFDPENIPRQNQMPELQLEFLPDGKLKNKSLKWTRGFIMDFDKQTASVYLLHRINGRDYLFIGFKKDEYRFTHRLPFYSVFKRGQDF